MVDILDLAAARVGDIRPSTHAYEWTLQGFGAAPLAPATR